MVMSKKKKWKFQKVKEGVESRPKAGKYGTCSRVELFTCKDLYMEITNSDLISEF